MIVVEGTLDAMAVAVAVILIGKSDWYCPVTQSGRQLSPQQLRYVLNLHAQPPLIAMDGDPPGRESNARLAAAIADMGKTATLVTLPNGDDPASWLATNGSRGLPGLLLSDVFQPSDQRSHLRGVIRMTRPSRNRYDTDPATTSATLGIQP